MLVAFLATSKRIPTHDAMRLALIANPCAGGNQAARIIPTVEAFLRRHGIDSRLFVTQHHEHALTIARHLPPQRFDGIVAIGGDGTNFHVLNGLLQHHTPGNLPPLGIIPVGSGNSFALDLGIRGAEDGLRALAEGRTRPVDVCRFDQGGTAWYFVNMAGLGFVTDVARTAHRLKRFGDGSYVMGVFYHVLNLRYLPMVLSIDGTTVAGEYCFVEICNSRYTGGRMCMAPDARIDDGLLDIVVVGAIGRASLLKTFPSIYRGRHGDHPAVSFFRGRRVRIHTGRPAMLLPDGEIFGTTPTEIAVQPALVRYFA